MEMNDFTALDLSGAGMSAQRERMRVVAENLANQHTTGPNGPYQRKEVILKSVPLQDFESDLTVAMSSGGDVPVQTVATQAVRPDAAPPIRVYEPNHPHADAQGYVSYPNISIFREMTDMVEASRSYEANMAAAKTTQDMLIAALELVRR
jgi:flagellar basal-body rod protein FlgC